MKNFCLVQSVISILVLKGQFKLDNSGAKTTELLSFSQKPLIPFIFN